MCDSVASGDPTLHRIDHDHSHEHSDEHSHDHGPDDGQPRHAHLHITRRRFHGLLAGAASVAAAGMTARIVTGKTAHAAAQVAHAQSYDGLYPIPNAMHIHASFSEQHGSFESQISEASRNNVAKMLANPGQFVVWFTEHDWREMAHAAPTALTFADKQKSGGKVIAYQDKSQGSLSQKVFEFTTTDVTPFASAASQRSLHLLGQSGGASAAEVLVYANFNASRLNHRTNLAGQTVSVDILPVTADGIDTYLEIRVALSYRPATGTRPAGQYMLSYRLSAAPSSYSTQQLLGIVTKQVTPGAWQQVQLDPIADITQLWPDMLAIDNSFQDIWFGVSTQNQQVAEGYFANVVFTRTMTDSASILANQQTIKNTLSTTYPGITLPRGREISFYDRHINGFGPGADEFIDYTANANAWSNSPGWQQTAGYVAQIQAAGGLASFNHPFGTGAQKPSALSSQDSTLLQVFASLLQYDVCGADILEVGFQERGGSTVDGGTKVVADIAHHFALWDMLSRNSRWITATGVSDNHIGLAKQWARDQNRFLTYPWAPSPAEADQLAALSSGRAYVGELGSFTGLLDLQVDNVVAMGQVSIIAGLTSRTLTVIAAGLPTGSTVNVVQGPIDCPGAATTSPGTVVVGSFPDVAFATGTAQLTIDTTASTFVRVTVVTSAGRTVAFSNPIYLINGVPARAVPANRLAADSGGGSTGTPTPTPTTTTPTSTDTSTGTSTATSTDTSTGTSTATSTDTSTGTSTATSTDTSTGTSTATSTATSTDTSTGTSTDTSTPTGTPTTS
jgi:hypothetical protein